MENLTMHLITIVSLIVILWVAVFLPWLVGLAVGRIAGEPNKDPLLTWVLGAFSITFIVTVIILIYSAYIDIFTYYTKP
jgi:ABC-type multidrug transport system fused ATPase/permease subunit